MKKCSWKDKANDLATKTNIIEVKDESSLRRNEENNKIGGTKKDQRTNQSVFSDGRSTSWSVSNDNETLSQTDKECITEHLMTSHLDLYNN